MKISLDISGPYKPVFEDEIYKFWEENEYFRPETQNRLREINQKGKKKQKVPRFSLTLPPPNVTGQLHLGHAITIAIEDLMVRYNRLCQRETLFLPGSDHAGIATQNVVERELNKQGISGMDLGREKFIEKIWEWKHKYHARITEQSKKLGMSSDWTRERFTLDENLSKAVRKAFVHFYKKGLIYRGQYLVNWCPGRCESAISDLESIPQEHESNLWYIKYPIIDNDWKKPQGEWGSGKWAKNATKFIEVATTRPETLLGDTGVATTDDHPIFGKLIGKKAVLPVNGREIPIFSDPHVDPEFGTGAVKVTPGHDPNDYEMGKTHDLEFITVLDTKGKMNPEYSGKYSGMDRFECRKKIVDDLKKEGLLVKIEPYSHAIAHCQRCNTIIEPRVSTQWFVKTKNIANNALEKVKKGETVILPKREELRFYQWMENIRDWCISRQLVWGHRIPVWYCSNGHQVCEENDPTSCPECKDTKLVQDNDVLDTWFSSGLWPFSTLGWPDENHPDFKRFYPTDMRETGYDILFFWVAREMMLGIELTGKTPYKTVYMHGIVRNEKGKKISKSMENVEQYDPLNIIADYGADSLRYNLVSNSVPGRDINLDPRQFEAARRFCNKIWNSTKFVFSHVKPKEEVLRFNKDYPMKMLELADKWIVSRLNKLIKKITTYMDEFDYLNATRDIKNFFWSEFCDWYIEITKIRLYDENGADKATPKTILFHILDTCFKLLHPIIPYITEALWQKLPSSIKEGPALIVANWPTCNDQFIDETAEEEFFFTIDLINKIRSARTDFNVPVGARIPLFIDLEEKIDVFENTVKIICSLAKIDGEKLIIKQKIQQPKHSIRIILSEMTAYMPLEGLIDIEAEKARILKNITKYEKFRDNSVKKLNSPFTKKAKPEIVQKERDNLAENERKIEQLKDQINQLN